MPLFARVSSYTTATVITATAHNNNENRIEDFLAGAISTHRGYIKFSGTDPALIVEQLSTGNIQEWKDSGSDIMLLTVAGTLEFYCANGVSAIDVKNSTTLCPNLNADLLDGLEANEIGIYNNRGLLSAAGTIDGTKSLILASDGGSGSYTLTLPSSTDNYDITIIKTWSTGILTISTQPGAVIRELGVSNSQTTTLSALKEAIRLVHNTADDWYIVSRIS